MEMMPLKHILLLITDQQRWDTISALGNSHIQTPNLDALALDSVVFERCTTPSPVCVPARFSLFSGQYPARTGCNNNIAENNYIGVGFYSELTKAGYQSCCVGKMHHLIDPYGPMGFERRCTQEELADPRDDYTKFVREKHPGVFDYHGMRSEMYYVPQISQLPQQDHPTQWIGDQSVEFIRNCDSNRPVFLMSSFIHPHPPFAPPAPWQKLYRKDPLGPFCPASEDMETFQVLIGERCSCERLMISEQDLLRQKNFYYACVSFVDYQIGRIIQALKDRNMYEDTLIVFTSDHGDMMGDYHAIGKRTMVDSACHIPFMIHYPGQAHQKRGDVCSLIDIAPTLLKYAGVDYEAEEYDGIDLFGGMSHSHVYSQYGCGEDGTYMVTNGTEKLVYSGANDQYYYFESIPEVRASSDLSDPKAQDLKKRLDEYRANETNKSVHSKTYEPVSKTHPHYPGRMDQRLFHEDELAAIPAGYTIDLE